MLGNYGVMSAKNRWYQRNYYDRLELRMAYEAGFLSVQFGMSGCFISCLPIIVWRALLTFPRTFASDHSGTSGRTDSMPVSLPMLPASS